MKTKRKKKQTNKQKIPTTKYSNLFLHSVRNQAETNSREIVPAHCDPSRRKDLHEVQSSGSTILQR